MRHVAVVAVVLVFGVDTSADEKKAGPRATVEKYVAAALAGRVDDAVGLAVDGQSPSRKGTVEEFKTLVDAKAVKMPTVWADEKKGQAVAVSEEIKITEARPDGRGKGHLVFSLVRAGDRWLVKDIDFRTGEKAKEQVDGFRKKNPDAKELPAKSGA